MVERTLEADELSAVIETIKDAVPLDFIPKLLEDPQGIFLKEHYWILKPLLVCEPKVLISGESMAQILDSVIKPMLPDGKAIVVETLVYDVKAMLSALRKLRRSWKFLAGRGSGDGANKWPSVSSSYDAKLLELLDLLDDGAQELKESAEMSEDDWDHELLFDVKLEEGDRERIELQKQLEKKRKCVMEADGTPDPDQFAAASKANIDPEPDQFAAASKVAYTPQPEYVKDLKDHVARRPSILALAKKLGNGKDKQLIQLSHHFDEVNAAAAELNDGGDEATVVERLQNLKNAAMAVLVELVIFHFVLQKAGVRVSEEVCGDVQLLEFFAGKARLASAWRNMGYDVKAIDIDRDTTKPYVALGNRLVGVTVAFALLAWWRGSVFTIENPKGSQLVNTVPMQYLISFFKDKGGLNQYTINLGDWGAESLKPLWIYSADDVTEALTSYTSFQKGGHSNLPVTYTTRDVNGAERVTGGLNVAIQVRAVHCELVEGPSRMSRRIAALAASADMTLLQMKVAILRAVSYDDVDLELSDTLMYCRRLL
ncbi:unnamed protein product [Symbiodinium microadriaticum]|nr:unnamed protein product [Symbiodinium microadriaticum]